VLISADLRLTAPERHFESGSESGSLLVSTCNDSDSLRCDLWWQERQNEMGSRLDVDFILAGCEDAAVVSIQHPNVYKNSCIIPRIQRYISRRSQYCYKAI
jgi:hypothetical protein